MKAEEIRVEYVETIARAFYEAEAADMLATTGEQLPPWTRLDKSDAHRAIQDARLAVSALTEAGLLPTVGGQVEILYRSRGATRSGRPVLDRHQSAESARAAVYVALEYAPDCERVAEFAVAYWRPLPVVTE